MTQHNTLQPEYSSEADAPPTQALAIPAPRRSTRWTFAHMVLGGFVIVCLPITMAAFVSLGQALTRSSNLPRSDRFVEWVRDHHGNTLVNKVEHWYYSRREPKKGAALSALPTLPSRNSTSNNSSSGPGVSQKGADTTVAGTDSAASASTLPGSVSAPADPTTASGEPAAIRPFVANPLTGEGKWSSLGEAVHGKSAMYVTFLRPDAVHTGVVIAVVHIDQHLARLQWVPGRIVPGHPPWPVGLTVDPTEVPSLLAAFNSGFRTQDADGGFYSHGRRYGTLRDGQASLVIRTDGRADIVQWGRDQTLTSDVVSVRQNLALVVDNGAPARGMDSGDPRRWGRTEGNTLFVWRSGVGVDANGNLVYVVGPGMNVHTLAEVLVRAGAVRGMELDINSSWVSFNVFAHDKHGRMIPGQATKILAGIKKPATRYLARDDRDWFAVLAR